MEAESLPAPDRALLVDHYEFVAPLIASAFGRIPMTTVFLPTGYDGPEIRVAQLKHEIPAQLPRISVTTRSGTHDYLALTVESLLWRVHAYAVGFETWSPTPENPLAVRFARLVLTAHGAATTTMLQTAAGAMRAMLNDKGLDAFLTTDGGAIVVWLPFDDAPEYDTTRAWLNALAADAANQHPDLFESKMNEPANCIRISARSNAPGHGACFPYSIRAEPGLPMNTPIAWSELAAVVADEFDVRSARDRIAAAGDVLASEIARIGAQRFADLEKPLLTVLDDLGPIYELQPRSDVTTVALQILADGIARTVDELIAEAIKRGLWPQSERRKYVYATLKAYVEKMVARGLKPLIVQDPDRRFRSNHPADDLPDPLPPIAWSAPRELIEALKTTASGTDPVAFERAGCHAFEPLGFAATHIGGTMNPDGYLDALLGPLGYRVMIECKTSAKPLLRPDVFEAAKFRDMYGARYAVMLAPGYVGDKETLDEAINHSVSLWTVDDLIRVLELGADPDELHALFAPGLASTRIDDLAWNRVHGPAKRLAVICDALVESGWNAQVAAADFQKPDDAPHLTEDAGILLVDAYLHERGSRTPCSRTDIRNAFAYLTSPRIRSAIWTSDANDAIVILKPATQVR